MKMRNKLFMSIVAVEVLIFGAVFSYVAGLTSARARETALETGRARAAAAASRITTTLIGAATTVEALGSSLETCLRLGRTDRSFVPIQLLDILKSSPRYYAVWAFFGPDGWDGKDARYTSDPDYAPTGAFVPWAYREKGEPMVYPGMAGEDSGYYESFYTIPIATGTGLYMEPYLEDSTEGQLLLVTYGRPVKDESGTARGVAGVDLRLDDLSKYLAAEEAKAGSEAGTFSFLVSAEGTILAHEKDASLIGKKLEEYLGKEEAGRFSSTIPKEGLDYSAAEGTLVRILVPMALPGDSRDWIYCRTVPTTSIYASTRRLEMLLVIFFAAGIGISIAAILMISRRLTRPLGAIGEAFSVIEGGDLTRRVSVKTRDEFGTLATQYNALSANLGKIFGSVRRAAEGIQETGQRLCDACARTNAALSGIRANIDESRAALESQAAAEGRTREEARLILDDIGKLEREIAAQADSINAASAAVEEMVGSIQSVAANAEKISSEMADLDRSTGEGKERLAAAIEAITEVSSHSDDLEAANATIAEISSRTDLLAMNAAIEAAHAGEAGKGFAVVADEIRALAENARVQSEEIGARIGAIHAAIRAAADSSREAGEAFDGVLGRVATVSRLEAEVCSAVLEQRTGGTEVLEALGRMKDTSRAVASAGETMGKASVEVRTAIDGLEEASERVKAAAQQIGERVNDIAVNGDATLGLAAENAKLLDSFAEGLSRFRIGEAPKA
jgi:methyl-accepting chemotaxis protein